MRDSSVRTRQRWQLASLLLDYPSPELLDRASALSRQLAAGDPLGELAAHLLEADPLARQSYYVETFDHRRRCPLYLTYFAHGDTRKRGQALLRFKQVYAAHGVRLTDAELPDHLCVVLEFAATVDLAAGRQLLLDHRAGLEVLRLSLRDLGSPYHLALEAVCAELPALRGPEREAVQRLAAEGPPEEEVGLTPYGDPAFATPAPARPGRVDLPMPTTRGA